MCGCFDLGRSRFRSPGSETMSGSRGAGQGLHKSDLDGEDPITNHRPGDAISGD